MLEQLAHNLWLLLTVVMPGMFTYGAWRLIHLFESVPAPWAPGIAAVDESSLVTSCIIVAVALTQQSFAILVEAVLALGAARFESRWPMLHRLFCRRFALTAAGRLGEDATRILGNFFLSVNISCGLGLILAEEMLIERQGVSTPVVLTLIVLMAIVILSACFRFVNALWALRECEGSSGVVAPKDRP